jgi:hypothetical protein
MKCVFVCGMRAGPPRHATPPRRAVWGGVAARHPSRFTAMNSSNGDTGQRERRQYNHDDATLNGAAHLIARPQPMKTFIGHSATTNVQSSLLPPPNSFTPPLLGGPRNRSMPSEYDTPTAASTHKGNSTPHLRPNSHIYGGIPTQCEHHCQRPKKAKGEQIMWH